MRASNNYPPGVTGNEPEIAGPYGLRYVRGWCESCNQEQRGELIKWVLGHWRFTCDECQAETAIHRDDLLLFG